MPLHDHVYDDGRFETIWINPDVPTIDEMLDLDGRAVFECPSDDCESEFDMLLEESMDVAEMIEDIADNNDGTIRCGRCDAQLYGIWKDGDHDEENHGAWMNHGSRP